MLDLQLVSLMGSMLALARGLMSRNIFISCPPEDLNMTGQLSGSHQLEDSTRWKTGGWHFYFCHWAFGPLSRALLTPVGTVSVQSDKAKGINMYQYNIT
jgi:hypothetical protein